MARPFNCDPVDPTSELAISVYLSTYRTKGHRRRKPIGTKSSAANCSAEINFDDHWGRSPITCIRRPILGSLNQPFVYR